jgi:hypothetical protein
MTRFLFCICLLVFSSCNLNSDQSQQNSNSSKNTIALTESPKNSTDSLQNQFALWLSGLNVQDSSLLYQNYSTSINKAWQKVEKTKLKPIFAFRDSFIPETHKFSTLFYPFSGGDFLYAHTFFPDVDTFILVGLEPAGTWFSNDSLSPEQQENYLSNLNQSLFFSNELGFFRTLSMEKELNQTLLNGTLHPILFYLSRLGFVLQRILPQTISPEGSLIPANDSISHFVNTLEFSPPNSKKKKILIYISQDLSNLGLKSRPGFLRFIQQKDSFAVFLKAASYLLHQSSFTTIQKFILDSSHAILQDDSGLPLRNLRKNFDHIQVFGEYTKTISLFNSFYQDDLKSLFQDSSQVKNPGFIIGYNQKFRQTNLIFAQKMRTL